MTLLDAIRRMAARLLLAALDPILNRLDALDRSMDPWRDDEPALPEYEPWELNDIA